MDKIIIGQNDTFTLNLNDPHAVPALLAYAKSVAVTDRALANSICLAVYKMQNPEGDRLFPIVVKDAYELMVEWPEQEKLNEIANQEDAAVERAIERERAPKVILDSGGEPLFLVVNEYDRGTPDTYYQPGDLGYNYWRVATFEEWSEFKTEQEARRG